MSLASLFFGFGLLLAGVYIIGQPWWRRSLADGQALDARAPHGSQIRGLEKRRDAAYAALSELESDYRAGKVNDEDYQAVRGRLLAEAVQTLQQIDAEQDIENLVMRRRHSVKPRAVAGPAGEAGVIVCPACGKRLGADARFCSGCGSSLTHACPACGRSVGSNDLFCGRCGAALPSPARA